MIDKAIASLWAKTDKSDDRKWHPLIFHLFDVAACADVILTREPETTRIRMGDCLGLRWEEARPWLLLIIACHDLGKACPGFQAKWLGAPDHGLKMPCLPNTKINHAFVSQLALVALLKEKGWPAELAELAADAVGCHHGNRASAYNLERARGEIHFGRGERLETISRDWANARQTIFEFLISVFQPSIVPDKETLNGPDFMLLSGLTSFADWLGSSEEWFHYRTFEDCADFKNYFTQRRSSAERALDAIGWMRRSPLLLDKKTFMQVFGFSPRPLQESMDQALDALKEPGILLVEAPMGEGKTEAAFYAHLELQRKFGHRGLYMALPTKATGNAMFERTLAFLDKVKSHRHLDLQLLHGAALLNDSFQALLSGIDDPGGQGEIRAGEWFTHKKRALLSEYGVGTVDQAILPILPVRHQFVRLWGLANRVVVFDEIHAYDEYTGTLLIYLLRWLLALGTSVVLLSATLPPSMRRKLAKEVAGARMPKVEKAYPRITIFQPLQVKQIHFQTDPSRRKTIKLQAISGELAELSAVLNEQLAHGGMGLALVNTVQRAQELYALFPEGEPVEKEGVRVGKRLADGSEIFLFHARFPADWRQKHEDCILNVFGGKGDRNGRKILIATQVAEQSLDLDFDVIVTDLAPVDLLLQRAGRLWRHARGARTMTEPKLIIAGLSGSEPPSFGKPLWWDSVYRKDLLLMTWVLLRERQTITLPDEIDALVHAVYEEQVKMPAALNERLENARAHSDGDGMAERIQAAHAIIGLPDDESWNEPGRFELFDEDAPGVHRTLIAQTRLGEESAVVIPLWPQETSAAGIVWDLPQAKQWFRRAVSLSRPDVVKRLRSLGVPENWKKSSLLHNCIPLQMDSEGRWLEDRSVRLDPDLGIVYGPKEAK